MRRPTLMLWLIDVALAIAFAIALVLLAACGSSSSDAPSPVEQPLTPVIIDDPAPAACVTRDLANKCRNSPTTMGALEA